MFLNVSETPFGFLLAHFRRILKNMLYGIVRNKKDKITKVVKQAKSKRIISKKSGKAFRRLKSRDSGVISITIENRAETLSPQYINHNANFDTPTRRLIQSIFDPHDSNIHMDSDDLTPCINDVCIDLSPSKENSFMTKERNDDLRLQKTWTPLDESVSLDVSQMLEWASLEISSSSDFTHSQAFTKTPCTASYEYKGYSISGALKQSYENGSPNVCDTRLVFLPNKTENDLVKRPASDPCKCTSSIHYNCPPSESACSEPWCYSTVNSLMYESSSVIESPKYFPKKRSFHGIEHSGETEKQIDLFHFTHDMELLNLDDFFES